MVRFILFTPDYPPQYGGVARYLGALAEASGGEMEVIVSEGQATLGPGKVRQEKIYWNFWPRWAPLIWQMRKRELQAPSSKLLISHVFPFGTAAWISKMFGGPEYFVLFHGLDLVLAKYFWKRWLLRRIVSNASQTLVNSEATKRLLQERVFGISPLVLTPGVEQVPLLARDEARQKFQIDPATRVVLSLSRLVARKGIDQALRSVAAIKKEFPDLVYVVVGDGPEREHLKDLVKELGIDVRWVSDCSDEERWWWYRAADIFLLPVKPTPDDFEGFGMVFLEASAAGLPNVAGRTDAVSEAVVDGETGILVDAENVGEISNAMRNLLNNASLRERLGSNGASRVKKDFDWKSRWEKLRVIQSPIS